MKSYLTDTEKEQLYQELKALAGDNRFFAAFTNGSRLVRIADQKFNEIFELTAPAAATTYHAHNRLLASSLAMTLREAGLMEEGETLGYVVRSCNGIVTLDKLDKLSGKNPRSN